MMGRPSGVQGAVAGDGGQGLQCGLPEDHIGERYQAEGPSG